MPFQDDPAIRPLFDTLEGGPPQAWKCLINIWERSTYDALAEEPDYIACGKITKTLDGMRLHQAKVHNYIPQMEIVNKPVTIATEGIPTIIKDHET